MCVINVHCVFSATPEKVNTFLLKEGVVVSPWERTEWDRPAAIDRNSRAKRSGVTDGLGLLASQLISTEEKPGVTGLKGHSADRQVGPQTAADTQTD